MSDLRFRILGPLEVVVDSGPVELGGVKQRAVLAALLLHANRVVSTAELIDLVWGDSPPQNARAALHVYLSRLRRLLAPAGSEVPLVTHTRMGTCSWSPRGSWTQTISSSSPATGAERSQTTQGPLTPC